VGSGFVAHGPLVSAVLLIGFDPSDLLMPGLGELAAKFARTALATGLSATLGGDLSGAKQEGRPHQAFPPCVIGSGSGSIRFQALPAETTPAPAKAMIKAIQAMMMMASMSSALLG
jgi:hypothetical protein